MKNVVMATGAILALLGLLSFIGNPIVGEGAFFAADATHGILLLATGIVVLWAAKGGASGAMYLKALGVIYVILAVLGFFAQDGKILGLVATNAASSWLQLVVAVVLLWAGFAGRKSGAMPMQTPPSRQGGQM
ncbi:MAG: DUF4383 domain-containing protein [Candidatus Colwellbacteria bacterium]|nr:DUF4383 domain-containing protein [Candidatus Colwellbacteria bacterium]